VYGSETRTQLYSVPYEKFEASIKRFGFSIDLNEEHLKTISPDIRLNHKELTENSKSAFAIVYNDEQFCFKDKRYNVSNLLKIGFLVCRHRSPEQQEKDLWHLINPKLEEFVTKKAVQQLL